MSNEHNEAGIPFPPYPGRLMTKEWYDKLLAWANQPRVRRVRGRNGIEVQQVMRNVYEVSVEEEQESQE